MNKLLISPGLLLAVVFVAAGLSPLLQSGLHADDSPALELFDTINRRLGHMQDVARYKAQNRIPIEDIAREQIVIADAQQSAQNLGLNAQSVEAFFAAQIAVAKAIQYRVRADLLSAPVSVPAPDLNSEIRPQISELGALIIAQLATMLADRPSLAEDLRTSFYASMSVSHVSDADKQLLFDALLQIRRD